MRLRTALIAGAGALLLAALGASLYWLYAAGAVRDGVERWVEERRAEGDVIGYRTLEIRGFPLFLRAEVSEPTLARSGAYGSWEWHGAALHAAIRPWNFQHLTLSFPGAQRVEFNPLNQERVLTASVGGAWAALALDPAGALQHTVLELENVELAGLSQSDLLRVGWARLEARFRNPPPPTHQSASIEISVTMRALDLPARAAGPLGPDIDGIQAEASLMGVIPPGPPAEAVAAWRDDGGTVELERLVLDWGPLELKANGTLALDQAMQPIGSLTAEIRGYAETLDALVQAGAAPPRDAAIAKVVLNLLAKTPPDGGPPVLTVPLTAQDGRLFVGPVALLELPPIEWP